MKIKSLLIPFFYYMQKTSKNFEASQIIISELIQQLIFKTNGQIRSRKLEKFISQELPADYLQYMTDISHLLHKHRQPSHTKDQQRTITEPNESISRQLHHHPHQSEQLFKTTFCKNKKQEEISLTLPSKIQRKNSLCLSHRSRKKSVEGQGQASRKMLYSRRKIAQNCRLVPLNKWNQEIFDSRVQDRISNLRKRKIKLQEAMKAFKQQQKPQKPFELKKSNKQNETLYTTDFKGRVINFNPKPMKNRNKQMVPFIIRYQTMVESSRSQNVWSKLTSNTRRVLFRQVSNPFHHQIELQKH